MLADYLVYDVPKQVVGGHLKNKPDKTKLREQKFNDPVDALTQEWVQMDWYTLAILRYD